MKVRAFTHGPMVPELRPARARRDWMDRFAGRHPYRCLPLAIANSFGWEVLSPCALRVDYDGGGSAEAITLTAEDDYPLLTSFAASNFTAGILTLHTGFIFRTDPGWSLFVTGPMNEPRDGMSPLQGIVETDWLPYPFTMNWQLERAGRYGFAKGEPFCVIVPVMVEPVADAEVEIIDGAEEPGLLESMHGFAARRSALIGSQREATPEATVEAWGREYFHGRLADGVAAPNHVHKLRLAEPVDRRPPEDREPPLVAPASSLVHSSRVAAGPALGDGDFARIVKAPKEEPPA